MLGARVARFAVPTALAAVAAAVPALGRGFPDATPRIHIDTIRLTADAASANVENGGTATLTLEPFLQRAAMRLLAAARPVSGAILVADARSGRILAWAGYRNGAPAPEVAVDTLAPAASVFKLITTTALLEKHVDPARMVCVEGGGTRISEDNLFRPRSGRALCGPFGEALGRSRNAVFAQLATRFLTPDVLLTTAGRFGFGADAPVDVPAPMGTLKVPIGELSFARAAAGFVGSRLSPMGALVLATIVATGGRRLALHLVSCAAHYAAPEHPEFEGRVMQEETARELRRMMEVTVNSGTSLQAFTNAEGRSYLGDVRAAGKTGTLQAGPDEPTTSWFIGFAPSRNPRIALSVLLENGPSYRRKANEVGRDVFRYYLAASGFRGVTMPDASQ